MDPPVGKWCVTVSTTSSACWSHVDVAWLGNIFDSDVWGHAGTSWVCRSINRQQRMCRNSRLRLGLVSSHSSSVDHSCAVYREVHDGEGASTFGIFEWAVSRCAVRPGKLKINAETSRCRLPQWDPAVKVGNTPGARECRRPVYRPQWSPAAKAGNTARSSYLYSSGTLLRVASAVVDTSIPVAQT